MDISEIVARSRASQNKQELAKLLEIVGTINPKFILEIGTWLGYSTEVFVNAFQPYILVTLEIDPGNLFDARFDFEVGNPVNVFNLNPVDSHDPIVALNTSRYFHDHPVDFLFIDGDHSYEGVKTDFELYSPFVRKGGIIAFHDAGLTDHPLVHVHKFWDEIRDNYEHVLLKAEQVDKNGRLQVGTGTGVLFV